MTALIKLWEGTELIPKNLEFEIFPSRDWATGVWSLPSQRCRHGVTLPKISTICVQNLCHMLSLPKLQANLSCEESLSSWLQFTLILSEVSRNEEEPAGYTSQNWLRLQGKKKEINGRAKGAQFHKRNREGDALGQIISVYLLLFTHLLQSREARTCLCTASSEVWTVHISSLLHPSTATKF